MLRIGVLASHQGTNFQAVVDACASNQINACVELLICNNSDALVIARAHKAGIPTQHLSSKTHSSAEHLDKAICDALDDAGIDLVVLAGYMKKLGNRTLNTYEDRIINVHPSLLPRHGGQGYYGMSVHEAVLSSGDTETGATVHLVSGEYDTGDTLMQQKTAVMDNDTAESLAARVHGIEHELLISVIEEFSQELTKCQEKP